MIYISLFTFGLRLLGWMGWTLSIYILFPHHHAFDRVYWISFGGVIWLLFWRGVAETAWKELMMAQFTARRAVRRNVH